MQDFVLAAQKLAIAEYAQNGMPVRQHIELSAVVGKRLAIELKADTQVVEAGTYLMDCAIGRAIKVGRIADHVSMSEKLAEELLVKYPISQGQKSGIIHCVREHHGVSKFYSLESEICCNADCYRFISVKGFSYALRFVREMPFESLIQLLENKADEKWHALTLDVCKQELTPQYSLIKEYLAYLKND
jgi:hypothetical protein